MTSVAPRMSLVAQYDDLCRYTHSLTTGCESEFRIFVEGQRQLLCKVKELQANVEDLRGKHASLDAEKKRLECQLKHMRSLLDQETNKRKKIEADKELLDQIVSVIQEVLQRNGSAIDHETKEKLVILSNTTRKHQGGDSKLTTIEESMGSLLSASDLDESDDTFNAHASRRRKRRSKGNRRSSADREQKKKKPDVESDLQSLGSNDFRMEIDMMPEKKIPEFRSNSEPSETSPHRPTRQVHRSDSDQVSSCRKKNSATLSVGTPRGRYSSGGTLSRTHKFVSKTVIRTERCLPCDRIITFCKQALKCSDCRVTCHPECREKCPVPCIPVGFTPTRALTGTIADYTSSVAPMIPSLIVQCVSQIEKRGLREVGLYRVSGPERLVKDLKDKILKGRANTTLNQTDVHVICGIIKEFLRSLSDPLLTRAAWSAFVEAAIEKDITVSLNLLYETVCELPRPNKDTLAYLILHLQRIAESPQCLMSIENLAKVLAPTIVGYSSNEPSDSDMLTETTQQFQVMHKLLMLPSDSWENLLNVEAPEVFLTPGHETPEITPAPVVPRLGPMYSSGHKQRSAQVAKTPLTPRNSKNPSKGSKRFFPSPLLK